MAGLKKLWDYTRNTQLWNSIFRHGPMDTARNRGLVVLTNVFLHLHPVKVRKSGIRLRFTWCMGGITFFLFLVEVATGLLLMFYYHPTVEYAYVDIVDLREQVPLGVMRELHRWGAHAMVITVWLHMLRVFMTGSYKPPREFNSARAFSSLATSASSTPETTCASRSSRDGSSGPGRSCASTSCTASGSLSSPSS